MTMENPFGSKRNPAAEEAKKKTLEEINEQTLAEEKNMIDEYREKDTRGE